MIYIRTIFMETFSSIFFVFVFVFLFVKFKAFYHLSIILIHFYWLFFTGSSSGIHCSSVSHFVETSYLTLIGIQLTGCHMMQEFGCGESRNRLQTVLHMCICVGALCVYVYVYMYVYIVVYIYIYIYMYIYMYIYI